ncbi:hypothetical protein Tco_0453294 [Tanacetum coccineum]
MDYESGREERARSDHIGGRDQGVIEEPKTFGWVSEMGREEVCSVLELGHMVAPDPQDAYRDFKAGVAEQQKSTSDRQSDMTAYYRLSQGGSKSSPWPVGVGEEAGLCTISYFSYRLLWSRAGYRASSWCWMAASVDERGLGDMRRIAVLSIEGQGSDASTLLSRVRDSFQDLRVELLLRMVSWQRAGMRAGGVDRIGVKERACRVVWWQSGQRYGISVDLASHSYYGFSRLSGMYKIGEESVCRLLYSTRAFRAGVGDGGGVHSSRSSTALLDGVSGENMRSWETGMYLELLAPVNSIVSHEPSLYPHIEQGQSEFREWEKISIGTYDDKTIKIVCRWGTTLVASHRGMHLRVIIEVKRFIIADMGATALGLCSDSHENALRILTGERSAVIYCGSRVELKTYAYWILGCGRQGGDSASGEWQFALRILKSDAHFWLGERRMNESQVELAEYYQALSIASALICLSGSHHEMRSCVKGGGTIHKYNLGGAPWRELGHIGAMTGLALKRFDAARLHRTASLAGGIVMAGAPARILSNVSEQDSSILEQLWFARFRSRGGVERCGKSERACILISSETFMERIWWTLVVTGQSGYGLLDLYVPFQDWRLLLRLKRFERVVGVIQSDFSLRLLVRDEYRSGDQYALASYRVAVGGGLDDRQFSGSPDRWSKLSEDARCLTVSRSVNSRGQFERDVSEMVRDRERVGAIVEKRCTIGGNNMSFRLERLEKYQILSLSM